MVTVRLVEDEPSDPFPATPELEPSASLRSGMLPKLQLESSELDSTGFGDVPGAAADGVGAEGVEGPASAGGCGD